MESPDCTGPPATYYYILVLKSTDMIILCLLAFWHLYSVDSY